MFQCVMHNMVTAQNINQIVMTFQLVNRMSGYAVMARTMDPIVIYNSSFLIDFGLLF